MKICWAVRPTPHAPWLYIERLEDLEDMMDPPAHAESVHFELRAVTLTEGDIASLPEFNGW